MENSLPAPAPPPIQQSPGGQNEFSFITDPKRVGKKGLLTGGGSKKNRILLVIGGLVGLAIIAGIVFTLISSFAGADKKDWVTLTQKQQELIRISDIGVSKAQNRDTKNLAATTSLSLKSTQTTVNSLAKKKGAQVDVKSLALGKDTKTDTALKTAEQTNQFDATFQAILKKELNEYQAVLKKLYENTNSKTTKAGLSTAFTNADVLAKQANQ